MNASVRALITGCLASGMATAGLAQCVSQDFESFLDGSLIGTQAGGLTFEAYDPLLFCTSFPEVLDLGGNNVVATGFDSDSMCFTNPQELHVTFAQGQETVSLSVGASTSGAATMTVTAYSTAFGGGGVQDSASIVVPNASLMGTVTLVRNTADIVRVKVSANIAAPEIVDNISFTDFTPPTAQLTSPALGDCVCDIVTVRGISCDEDGTFHNDRLEYVRIDPPDDNTWKFIGSASSPLCAEGALYNWNTTSVSEGLYRLRMTSTNDCGLQSSDYRTVYVDKDFDTISVRSPIAGNVYGGTVCFDGSVGDARCFVNYTVQAAPDGSGAFGPVDPGNPTYTTPVSNDPFALWDTTGLPDGDYELMITGTTTCRTRTDELGTITIDNTPAEAKIESPTTCSALDGPIDFYGVASDAHFTGYSLQILGGPYRQWTTFSGGSTAVEGGLLGTLNPDELQLPDCCYAIRLVVTTSVLQGCNLTAQTSTDHMTLHIGSMGGSSCPEDIDADGTVGLSDLAAVLGAFGLSCP